MGTVDYMAPEIIAEEDATPAADLFSFGVMIYILLTGEKSMFYHSNHMLAFQKILNCDYELEEHKNLTPQATDLIKKLLVRDPQKRLGAGPEGFHQLKQHSFFEGINFDTLFLKNPPKV